jgi:PilZ domain
MFKRNDRRQAPRFAVSVPLRVRIGNDTAPEELIASINLSERGVYFETSSPVQKGLAVRLSFEMPEEVSGVPATQWNCAGEVVRVESSKTPGKVGVGIRIDHWKL